MYKKTLAVSYHNSIDLIFESKNIYLFEVLLLLTTKVKVNKKKF